VSKSFDDHLDLLAGEGTRRKKGKRKERGFHFTNFPLFCSS